MFKVSESKVTRWIRHQGLPAQRVAGQYHFNRVEVLDWAVAHQVRMEASPVDQLVDGVPSISLADALEAGGIHYKISGDERQAALRALVSRLPLPKDFDGELLMGLLLAREAHGFKAVGDGIAIPHVRYPIVLNVARALLTLCFLHKPIAYQAPDGKPVRILFTVISPTVATHVQLLAQLSRALHKPSFRKCVVERGPREIILQEVRRLEKAEQPVLGSSPRAA